MPPTSFFYYIEFNVIAPPPSRNQPICFWPSLSASCLFPMPKGKGQMKEQHLWLQPQLKPTQGCSNRLLAKYTAYVGNAPAVLRPTTVLLSPGESFRGSLHGPWAKPQHVHKSPMILKLDKLESEKQQSRISAYSNEAVLRPYLTLSHALKSFPDRQTEGSGFNVGVLMKPTKRHQPQLTATSAIDSSHHVAGMKSHFIAASFRN